MTKLKLPRVPVPKPTKVHKGYKDVSYKTCPDCGERVYRLGCTYCNEEAYIEWANVNDWAQQDEYRETVLKDEETEQPEGIGGDSSTEE